MRVRPGFTLVEVLLAVFLIDVGLLALVASSAILVRETSALRLRNVALRAATNRLQQLGSAACRPVTGSSTTPDGIREDWAVTVAPTRVLDLRDSVSFTIGTTTHRVVLRTRLPC